MERRSQPPCNGIMPPVMAALPLHWRGMLEAPRDPKKGADARRGVDRLPVGATLCGKLGQGLARPCPAHEWRANGYRCGATMPSTAPMAPIMGTPLATGSIPGCPMTGAGSIPAGQRPQAPQYAC